LLTVNVATSADFNNLRPRILKQIATRLCCHRWSCFKVAIKGHTPFTRPSKHRANIEQISNKRRANIEPACRASFIV